MPHCFDGIDEKLQRAQEHVAQLRSDTEALLQADLYGSAIAQDHPSAEAFRTRQKTLVVPLGLSVLVGETVYQLRSALDHMVCLFVVRDGGTVGPQTQFPILTQRPTERNQLKRYKGQIRGIEADSSARALIEKRQPYNSRLRLRHPLAVLQHLSNTDKHRGLVLHTVAVQPILIFRISDGVDIDEELTLDEDLSDNDLANTFDGFQITDVKRQLSAYVAFSDLETVGRNPPAVITRLRFLSIYVHRIIKEARDLFG